MSDAGIARLRELSLAEEDLALIERALSQ